MFTIFLSISFLQSKFVALRIVVVNVYIKFMISSSSFVTGFCLDCNSSSAHGNIQLHPIRDISFIVLTINHINHALACMGNQR